MPRVGERGGRCGRRGELSERSNVTRCGCLLWRAEEEEVDTRAKGQQERIHRRRAWHAHLRAQAIRQKEDNATAARLRRRREAGGGPGRQPRRPRRSDEGQAGGRRGRRRGEGGARRRAPPCARDWWVLRSSVWVCMGMYGWVVLSRRGRPTRKRSSRRIDRLARSPLVDLREP